MNFYPSGSRVCPSEGCYAKASPEPFDIAPDSIDDVDKTLDTSCFAG